MDAAGLTLAAVAGMLAVVNPCGFALLPAYVTFLVAGGDRPGQEGPGRARAVGRALALAAAMTAGFVAVFAVFGVLIAFGAGAVQRHLPWFTIVLGLALMVLGGWLAITGNLALPLPKLTRAPQVRRSVPSMVLFGAAYALTSLGCTIGPFLALVASSFRAGSVAAGLAGFAAYAAGMGLVVAVVALAVALARTSVIRGLRRLAPVITRAGGVLLALAGGYVAYYGWYEVRAFSGADADDPLVRGAGAVQRWLAGGLERLGATGLAVLAVVVLGAGLAAAASARVRARR